MKVTLRVGIAPDLRTYPALFSPNTREGELPFRLTWFKGSEPIGHVDIKKEEINNLAPPTVKKLENVFGGDTFVIAIR